MSVVSCVQLDGRYAHRCHGNHTNSMMVHTPGQNGTARIDDKNQLQKYFSRVPDFVIFFFFLYKETISHVGSDT